MQKEESLSPSDCDFKKKEEDSCRDGQENGEKKSFHFKECFQHGKHCGSVCWWLSVEQLHNHLDMICDFLRYPQRERGHTLVPFSCGFNTWEEGTREILFQ